MYQYIFWLQYRLDTFLMAYTYILHFQVLAMKIEYFINY